MEGGRLFDEGTYGCIFDPPLLCEKAKQRKYVENLMKKRRYLGKISELADIESEVLAAIVLKRVPNYAKYFAVADPASVCSPADIEKQKDPAEVEKCGFIFTHRYASYEDTMHYVMPYGGLLISQFREKLSKPTVKPVSMRAFIKHLLEAGAHMLLNGVIHFDLHYRNVVVDARTSLPRIIDFGQTFLERDINEQTIRERRKMYEDVSRGTPGGKSTESPEVIMYTGVVNRRTPAQAALDIRKNNPYSRLAQQFLGVTQDEQTQALLRFWASSAAAQRQDWVSMFRMYWPGQDAWGIGIILVEMMKQWSYSAALREATSDWEEIQSQMKELLRGLLQFDPRKRFDCLEALCVWDPENTMCLEGAGAAWLAQRAAVRAGVKRATGGGAADDPLLPPANTGADSEERT